MNIFKSNKPFFIFLLKFGGTYLVLSLLYVFYLSQYNAEAYEVDGITRTVAKQSAWITNVLGMEAFVKPLPDAAAYRFYINGKYFGRVVEGCNAVSVMILFVAFVVAFSTTFKRTSLFIVVGLVLIYILNVLRISLVNIAVFYYPSSGHVLHDVVFPLFIYSVVVLLWIAWLAKFKGSAKR